MSLYESIGTSTPEKLLAKTDGVAITVNLTPGSGTIKRGTVIYKVANTGLWSPAAADQAVITNQLAIIDEEVDAAGTAATGKTIAATARAYIEGTFVDGTVKLTSNESLTAAVKTVLRAQGIKFAPVVGGASFENSVTTG